MPETPIFSFFKKDVDRVVHNTAKYLMNEMPDDLRWALLAMLDRKLYCQDGRSASEKKHEFSLECGIKVSYYYGEGDYQNYYFVGANGEEAKVEDARNKKGHGERYFRWFHIVLRCANLVGNKDILALFPEEVKAMRKHYKQRLAQVNEQKDATTNETIEQADAMLQTLPSDAQERLIAEAAGMYYNPESYEMGGTDWKTASVFAKGALYLGNGSRVVGPCNDGDAPVVRELLRKVPHRVILEHYAEALKKMARYMAKDRFQNMPGTLRDALLCELTGKLTTADGSPAVDGETTMNLEVPDPARRTVPIPCAKVNVDKARFTTSRGIALPYSSIKSYLSQYTRSVQLAHLCALILGPEELAKCIPQGGEEEKEELPQTPQKSAMGSGSLEGAASPKDAQYAEGVAALRRMSSALRRAWLAENMGLCYTQSNAPAYMAPHVVNDNALFVDEQGKERKLSEVATDKMAPDWVAATKAALAVGHEQVAMPFKEELKTLAVQTATYILNTLPKEARNSWLAEKNRLFFRSNGQSVSPVEGTSTLESGFQLQFVRYGGKLFYNPQGEITQPVCPPLNVWLRRWHMLFRCENVAGIEAINAAFKADVDAMRAAYEKSPYYKK